MFRGFLKLSCLLILSILLNVNAWAHDSDLVEGNGFLKSEKRSLPLFNRMKIEGSYVVKIERGESQDVELVADENILPLIKTETEGSLLHVYTAKPFSTENLPKLVVNAIGFVGIELLGMNNVTISQIATDEFRITSGGSDTVSVSGVAKTFLLTTAGNADIDAKNLKAEFVEASVGGVSNAHVYASKTLKAKVVGVGNIFCSGQPDEVTREVLGIGEISLVH